MAGSTPHNTKGQPTKSPSAKKNPNNNLPSSISWLNSHWFLYWCHGKPKWPTPPMPFGNKALLRDYLTMNDSLPAKVAFGWGYQPLDSHDGSLWIVSLLGLLHQLRPAAVSQAGQTFGALALASVEAQRACCRWDLEKSRNKNQPFDVARKNTTAPRKRHRNNLIGLWFVVFNAQFMLKNSVHPAKFCLITEQFFKWKHSAGKM